MDRAKRLDVGGLNGLFGFGLYGSRERLRSHGGGSTSALRSATAQGVFVPAAALPLLDCEISGKARMTGNGRSTGPHGLAAAFKLVTPVAVGGTMGQGERVKASWWLD